MSERREQYRDASNLDARIALHSRFGRNNVAWSPWVFDHLTLPKGARVLVLGCGPAKLWLENLERIPEDWRVTLTDASPGMIREAGAYLTDGRAGSSMRLWMYKIYLMTTPPSIR